MDPSRFEQQAQADPQLQAFLRSVAEDAAKEAPPEGPQQSYAITGVDILVTLAALALYRLATTIIQLRAAAQQTALAERQAQLIQTLIHDGIPPKQAQAIVTALLKGLKLDANDPMLQKALGILGQGQK
jgi:hypothetical protein